MKTLLILSAATIILSACDARISTPSQPEKTVEKNTTIVNPPAAPVTEEKKSTTTTTTH